MISQPCSCGLGEDRAGGVGEFALAQRAADRPALGEQEGVGHRAADRQPVDLARHEFEEIELGRDLGAADQRDDRVRWVFEGGAERLQFGLHVLPRRRRQEVRQRRDRGVRAVRRRERVIDIEVAERRQLLREAGVVLFLLRVEAQVFQQRHLAGVQCGDDARRLGADAVAGEMHRPAADRPAQRLDQGPQRLRRIGALRAAEMRHHDDLGAAADERLDGRREALDAGRVGHLAVPDRYVQIGAQQHPLAGDVEIVRRAKPRHGHPLPGSSATILRCVMAAARPLCKSVLAIYLDGDAQRL